jgi:hypothetical protein
VLRNALQRAVFAAADIRQIHIIGCSRSGTTMLQAAMSAFERVMLNPGETSAAEPALAARLSIVRRAGLRAPARRWYVTKRAWNWHSAGEIGRLAERALRDRVGIVQIVRDPRDVLLSRHRDHDRARYVSTEHWRRSVVAGRALEAQLAGRVPFLTVRYEDVILEPRAVEAALASALGLSLRPGARLDRIADSIASAGIAVWDRLTAATHGMRNADARSIGKWRDNPDNPEPDLLADGRAAPVYRDFLDRHGYAAGFVAA